MLVCVRMLGMPPMFCQHVLEELVDHPRDRRRRNLKDDAGRRAGEKPGETTQPVHRSCRRHNAMDMFAVRHGAAFLRIQQSLAYVERRRKSSGDRPGEPAGKHVGHGPVLAVPVYQVLCEFVDDKVKTLVGNIKYQLRAETVVERSPAFLNKNLPSAVDAGPVRRSVHLQALFYHCNYTK